MPVEHHGAGAAGGKGGQFAPKGKRDPGGPVDKKPRKATAKKAAPAKPPKRPPPAPKATPMKRVGQQLRKVAEEDLADAWVKLLAEPESEGRTIALDALDKELARREGLHELARARDDEKSRRVDELVAGGEDYLDAYAEAHGLTDEDLRQAELDAVVDANRIKGERRRDTLRRMYAEQVYVQVLAAETATRGELLNPLGRAKKIVPATLWSGQAARARKYASDELKRWWEAHGGRMTWTQFEARYVRKRRAGAKVAARGEVGRDFGL